MWQISNRKIINHPDLARRVNADIEPKYVVVMLENRLDVIYVICHQAGQSDIWESPLSLAVGDKDFMENLTRPDLFMMGLQSGQMAVTPTSPIPRNRKSSKRSLVRIKSQ